MTLEERLSFRCCFCLKDYDLVRDHCHKTGYIRGILCDRCNSYLGLYESNHEFNKRKYHHWLNTYKDDIDEYRSKHVGIKYKGHNGGKVRRAMREAGVSLNYENSKEYKKSGYTPLREEAFAKEIGAI